MGSSLGPKRSRNLLLPGLKREPICARDHPFTLLPLPLLEDEVFLRVCVQGRLRECVVSMGVGECGDECECVSIYVYECIGVCKRQMGTDKWTW